MPSTSSRRPRLCTVALSILMAPGCLTLLSDDDPSPINDPLTYVPEQHDCPSPCRLDYANVHRWTPYLFSLPRSSAVSCRCCSISRSYFPWTTQKLTCSSGAAPLEMIPASAGDRTVSQAQPR